jgi:hypothetical protein
MLYEVVYKIENNCKRNQMRDVFFEEAEIADPDQWIRQKAPNADIYDRENIPGGIRYRVVAANMLSIYELTPAE